MIGEFKTVGYVLVKNVHEAEKTCHEKLKNYRYQNNREFFKINIQKLLDEIRNILSDYIIADNLPKYKVQSDDNKNLETEKIAEELKNFYVKIYDYMDDFWWSTLSSSELKKISKSVYEALSNIKNIDTKYLKESGYSLITSDNTPENILQFPVVMWTKRRAYCLQFWIEHKNFIGFDTSWVYGIFEQKDLKDNCSSEAEVIESRNREHAPTIDEITKIELITKNDPEYFNKAKQTRTKIEKIYGNDQLFLEYKDINSKGSQQFYNLDNYFLYAFFSQAERKKTMIKKTDGKKVWEEEDFELVNTETIFWKGSIDRVLVELSDIIRTIPDYIDTSHLESPATN